MIEKQQYKGITWIDLNSPSQDEIDEVVRQFKLHPLIREEMSEPSARPKVDPYKDYIYLILHFPVYNHGVNQKDQKEIDFIIGKHFIITTHYQHITSLSGFMKKQISAEIVGEHKSLPHAGFIFYHLLKHLYESIEVTLGAISDRLVHIEEKIYQGMEKEMVDHLGDVSHDILDFKRSLKSHSGVLNSYENAGGDFFGSEFKYYLHDLIGEHTKLWNIIEDQKEMLVDLRETNDSLLNSKTNEVMKFLTIMAFITFPLSLFAGIFGMNTKHIPIVGHSFDFWIIVGAMMGASLGMILFFKYKKWF